MRVPWFAATCLLAASGAAAPRSAPRLDGWADLLDHAAKDPTLAAPVAEVVARAREVAARPLARRATSRAELALGRFAPDARSLSMPEAQAEAFALALSDVDATSALAIELPQIAAGYRLSGERELLERALAQLDELAGWTPLQRSGWSGTRPKSGAADGVWLATGMGIRAITDALEILPPNVVPEPLSTRLRAALVREVRAVLDDWRLQRMWFVRNDNPRTNQWVLPSEGLLRASLFVGDRAAADIAVGRLLRTLDSLGPSGEFDEGLNYALMTAPSLFSAARAAAAHGDRRLAEHPYLRHLSRWLGQHLQPGGAVVNAFDSRWSIATMAGAVRRPDDAGPVLREVFSQLWMIVGDPVARWGLDRLGGPSADLAGLGASLRPGVGAAPPTFAADDRARRVTWRSAWDEDGDGVWVRGGHPLEQHDHEDRGHVNFILHGRPIFIEAGTPVLYARMSAAFRSVEGHNVLAVGDAGQRPHCAAPIAVEHLGVDGGQLTVDASGCYPALYSWRREVGFASGRLDVVDRVHAAARAPVALRWHTGSEAPVSITGAGSRYLVRWPGVAIVIEADRPLSVTQAPAVDQTIGMDSASRPHTHSCLLLSVSPSDGRVVIKTRVRQGE